MKTFLKRVSILVVGVLVLSCSSDSSTPACTPITCLNGGVSTATCGCYCPQGYTGSDCGIQITPTKITITQIKVTRFPSTKTDGTVWDSFAVGGYVRPDIFPFLTSNSGTVTLFQGTAVQDAFSTIVYTWNLTTPLILTPTQFNSQLELDLYDEDTAADEFMGGWNFYIYNQTGGFPTSKTIGNSTGTVTFELSLSYTW